MAPDQENSKIPLDINQSMQAGDFTVIVGNQLKADALTHFWRSTGFWYGLICDYA